MKFLTLESLAGVLLLAGLIVTALGVRQDIALLTAGGIAVLGLAGIVMGLGAIIKGEWKLMRRRRVQSTYSGFRARLIGVMLVMIGIAFAGASTLMLRGGFGSASATPLQQFMQSDTGLSVASIGLGIAACMWGLLSVLGSDQNNRSAGALLLSLPLRLISLGVIVIGIAVLAFGLARIFAPEMIPLALRAFGLNID